MASGEPAGGAPFPLPTYLRDLMGLYARMMKAQTDRAQRVIERMAGGEYTADDWVRDASQFWTRFVFDGISVMEAFQKSAAGDTVPTCVFILDDPAEGGDPKSLPHSISNSCPAP